MTIESLKAEIAALEARIAPLRQNYDRISQESRRTLDAIAAEVQPLERECGALRKKLVEAMRAAGFKVYSMKAQGNR